MYIYLVSSCLLPSGCTVFIAASLCLQRVFLLRVCGTSNTSCQENPRGTVEANWKTGANYSHMEVVLEGEAELLKPLHCKAYLV